MPLYRFFALGFAAAFVAAAPVHAQTLAEAPAQAPTQASNEAQDPPTPTMLIIDGSGSMWGRFGADKRAKVDLARELIPPHIEKAGDLPVGLTLFGHRRRSDCSDVEVVSPPVSDRTAVKDAILNLNPRGKGPLTSALRSAVGALDQSRPANVIVLHDGPDNCRQDPCAAAEEIAKTSPKIAVHVVSIGISANDVPRLSCIATATGGTFHVASDLEGLTAALDAVAKIALDASGGAAPSSEPAPEAASPGATGTGLQATAALAADGPALSVPVHWRISKAGAADVIAESDGASFKAKLDPGTYDVEASLGHLRAKREVTVAAGGNSGIIVPLDAARLTVTSKGERSAATSQTLIVTIDPAKPIEGQPSILSRKLAVPAILSPGAYTVTVTDGNVRNSKSVKLSAGDDATLAFALGAGRIELSAGFGEDGGAIDDVVFSISEDDPDSPDGRREIARSRAPSPSFTLPAGTYYASARSGDGEVHERIAVGAGDIVNRTLVLPLVTVKVSAAIGGEPASSNDGITYRVTALDGERREIVRSVLPNLTLSLLPGRYHIAAHLDAHHLKAAEEVAIEPGKAADIVLKFDAAEIDLRPGPGAAAAGGDVFWEITDDRGTPVWRSLSTEAKAYLAPGRYSVHLDSRGRSASAAFEVKAGERKVVEVGLN